MSKKGDLSISVIIVAALGLIVLVVLAAIFVNKMQGASTQGENTVEQFTSNVCMNTTHYCVYTGNCPSGNPVSGSFIDCGTGKCCRRSTP